MKELQDAREIRQRLITCIKYASQGQNSRDCRGDEGLFQE